ncbi:MFS transporter [Hyphomonas sp.]|uniref:MFS transporter n=1 Tax=Hyphomonas sp. TaxID=87 RepID=UPI00391C8BBF
MSDYRNVITLILAICLMQAAASFMGVITPVGLSELKAGETLTGLVGAVYSAGFMAGAWLGPALLGRYGTIRLYAAAAAITAVCALVMGMVPGIAAWGAARIMQGIGFGLLFASAESWLGQAVPKDRRGDMMGFYYFLSRIAGLLAPFLAFGLSALDPRGLNWVSILLCMSLVTLCLTRQAEPAPPEREVMRPLELFRLAPSAVTGCFLAGLLNTGTLALLPTWTSTFAIGGGGTGAAAMAAAAAAAGALMVQWPAGRISDKVERRLVVAGLSLFSGAAALALAAGGTQFSEPVVLALLGLWGAGAFAFYGVCAAHAIDRAGPARIPQVMSGILFVWAAGSVIGPVMSGVAMSLGGPQALFGVAAAGLFLLAGVMLVRSRVRAAPATVAPEAFMPAEATSVAVPVPDLPVPPPRESGEAD